LKTLWSDNGGEFINKVVEEFLTKKGIWAEKLLPYHHYQNGMIERFNRTIQDMGRTILIDSALPKTFWSYTFPWANHVLNRIQNKSSGDMTPYKGLFHVKPRYNGFRVFGAVCYIHIPEEKRR
jgi:transposase InsO family protein